MYRYTRQSQTKVNSKKLISGGSKTSKVEQIFILKNNQLTPKPKEVQQHGQGSFF